MFSTYDINRFAQTFSISGASRQLATPCFRIISIRMLTNQGNNSMALSTLRQFPKPVSSGADPI